MQQSHVHLRDTGADAHDTQPGHFHQGQRGKDHLADLRGALLRQRHGQLTAGHLDLCGLRRMNGLE